MLGVDESHKSAVETAPGRQAGTRALLALATAAAALFVIAGSAQAQECVGGYRMIKDEIPIRCDVGFEQSTVDQSRALLSEPPTTGSIGAPPAVAPAEAAPGMSPGGMKCVGGYHWKAGVENSYTTLPLPCDRM